MKIEDRRPTEIDFDEISAGGIFEHNGELYMSTCHSSADKYNAVNLKNGLMCFFNFDEKVMPVSAKVVIK